MANPTPMVTLPGGLTVPEHEVRESVQVFMLRDGRMVVGCFRRDDLPTMLGMLDMAKEHLIDQFKQAAEKAMSESREKKGPRILVPE